MVSLQSCTGISGAYSESNLLTQIFRTTTAQTENLAASLSHTLGYTDSSRFVELVVRGLFFTCNLLSNALMWILFTRALTAANSTTRVSVLNTSANFMVTAVLGMAVFSEGLPLAWWGGAVMLLTGSVIIGRRDEEGKETKADGVALGERQSIDQAQAKDVGSTGGASDSEIYKDDSNEDNERSQRNQKRFRDEI